MFSLVPPPRNYEIAKDERLNSANLVQSLSFLMWCAPQHVSTLNILIYLVMLRFLQGARIFRNAAKIFPRFPFAAATPVEASRCPSHFSPDAMSGGLWFC